MAMVISSTLSAKNQVTLPARVREILGVGGEDNVINYEIDEARGTVRIFGGKGLDELAEHFTALVPEGVPPLENPSEYTEKHYREKLS